MGQKGDTSTLSKPQPEIAATRLAPRAKAERGPRAQGLQQRSTGSGSTEEPGNSPRNMERKLLKGRSSAARAGGAQAGWTARSWSTSRCLQGRCSAAEAIPTAPYRQRGSSAACTSLDTLHPLQGTYLKGNPSQWLPTDPGRTRKGVLHPDSGRPHVPAASGA